VTIGHRADGWWEAATVLVTCVVASVAGCVGSGPTPGEATRAPLNVLVLVIDDARRDALGAAGNPVVHTPRLDALAADGVRLDQAFVTTSICMVSRASIFTGQYMSRYGITLFGTTIDEAAWTSTYPSRPSVMQGRDLAALYLGADPEPWRNEFFYERPTITSRDRIPSSMAVVRRDWKYVY